MECTNKTLSSYNGSQLYRTIKNNLCIFKGLFCRVIESLEHKTGIRVWGGGGKEKINLADLHHGSQCWERY